MLRFIQEQIQLILKEQKEQEVSIQPEFFIRQFQTLDINTIRQAGKTTTICDFIEDNHKLGSTYQIGLVCVYHNKKHLIRKFEHLGIQSITKHIFHIDDWLKLEYHDYDIVFFDECPIRYKPATKFPVAYVRLGSSH